VHVDYDTQRRTMKGSGYGAYLQQLLTERLF